MYSQATTMVKVLAELSARWEEALAQGLVEPEALRAFQRARCFGHISMLTAMDLCPEQLHEALVIEHERRRGHKIQPKYEAHHRAFSDVLFEQRTALGNEIRRIRRLPADRRTLDLLRPASARLMARYTEFSALDPRQMRTYQLSMCQKELRALTMVDFKAAELQKAMLMRTTNWPYPGVYERVGAFCESMKPLVDLVRLVVDIVGTTRPLPTEAEHVEVWEALDRALGAGAI